MKNLQVIYHKAQHISRLLTGFHLLEKSGEVKCNYFEDLNNQYNLPQNEVVEVQMSGKRIAFDMGDRMSLHHSEGKDYLEKVDAYFARSYEQRFVDTITGHLRAKIKPFGFDYYVTYPGNPADILASGFKSRIMHLARHISGYDKCMRVEAFEREPDYKKDGIKIIFMTRLWDPGEINLQEAVPEDVRQYREYMVYERNKINAERIEIVKQLQKRYGDAFTGGIQYSDFANKMCPDILIPKELTRKKVYLDKMQSSDICIGSAGLHHSIGWKTGEYVAASRAIVAERFYYQLPGNFKEGVNYSPFDTVDQCLEAVEGLFSRPDAIYKMKMENHNYYINALRPEIQIMNAFNQCF